MSKLLFFKWLVQKKIAKEGYSGKNLISQFNKEVLAEYERRYTTPENFKPKDKRKYLEDEETKKIIGWIE